MKKQFSPPVSRPARPQSFPARKSTPVPAVPPGQERANENFREQAETGTEVAPPDANAHIREEYKPQDPAPTKEKDKRNPSAPGRGFDRGDSRSQPDNFHPYTGGDRGAPRECETSPDRPGP